MKPEWKYLRHVSSVIFRFNRSGLIKYEQRTHTLVSPQHAVNPFAFDSSAAFSRVSSGILMPKERTDGMPTSASLLGVAILEWWWHALGN